MDRHRLGYALQLTTHFLGTFLKDPAAVPGIRCRRSSASPTPDCVLAYRESEIRVRYGYREFADSGIQFCLEPWLSA